MPDHDITPSTNTPEVEPTTIEQVLTEAADKLPVLTLPGGMRVVATVLPYGVGRLLPKCALCRQTLPTQFVWEDISSDAVPGAENVYCHLRCAAIAAVTKAEMAAVDERIVG